MNHSEFDSLVDAIATDVSAEELLYDGLRGIIAAEISMKRQQLGLSQKAFAAMLHVSQGLVSRWERGETNFTLESLVKISSALGLEMQSPFKSDPPKIPYVSVGRTVFLEPVWSGSSFVESKEYEVSEM